MNWCAIVTGTFATIGVAVILYFTFTDYDFHRISMEAFIIIGAITALCGLSCGASLMGGGSSSTRTIIVTESVELRTV